MKKTFFLDHPKLLLLLIYGSLFGFVLLLEPWDSIYHGFLRILTNPSILISDYLLIGGLAATLLNVLVTTFLNILIIRKLKLPLNGPILAFILTIGGFAFFGKNIFNGIPMYIGVFLYSYVTKRPIAKNINVLLLSSGLSPVVSYLIFGLGLHFWMAVPLAISTGILIGFILPVINAHSLKVHQGYNLYNTGFSMGIISVVITAILSLFVQIERSTAVSNAYHSTLFIGSLLVSIFLIIAAFILDRNALKSYRFILKQSGRLASDFVAIAGWPATLLNMGLMGLFALTIIVSLNLQINGPIMGAVWTLTGFAAYGKHPMNSFPVVLGAITAVVVTPIEMTLGPVLSIFFVTSLAPIAGRFGVIPGFVTGFIQILITPLALSFQGGFDLYNNGFAAGFVGALMVPLLYFVKSLNDEHLY